MAPALAGETHIVEINGMEFTPAVLDVAVGDAVIWVNNDIVPHTATDVGGVWNSGSMEQGDEWSLTVESAGAIDYLCAFHPQMTGVINAR